MQDLSHKVGIDQSKGLMYLATLDKIKWARIRDTRSIFRTGHRSSVARWILYPEDKVKWARIRDTRSKIFNGI